ncbi:hypothetical protein LAV60_04245 [Clostridium sporogenes]|uniref:HEPN domain-containing protein n=1 Tax=Clostridium sporogenes TaxID=1509 RepID=UPI002237DA18|nr:HEPN domain-containing protein [Clostridium sporogenes]MCW6092380.1 hypothetical protein [Clostridium sporogenes]
MDMKNLTTEYMVVFNLKDSLCTDVNSFNNLIQSNADIKIKGSKLYYRELEVDYSVEAGEISNSQDRYYHLKIVCQDSSKMKIYEDLLKDIRVILNRTSSRNVEVLWDDISFYYAKKAYPLIHEIENLMRKLITKFMLVNVGVGWVKKNVPDIVKDSIRDSRKDLKEETDYLYRTDFIQLSNFLFVEYSLENVSNLIKKLKSLNNEDSIHIENLKNYVSKSNWERYFSTMVDCEYEYLKNKWQQLYELRCKVAHNNRMNRADYENTEKIVNEIREKLIKAIDNIDKLDVSDSDKENISESMITNTNELYGQFIVKWKDFEQKLFNYLTKKSTNISDKDRYRVNKLICEIYDLKLVQEPVYKELKIAREIRNIIVHESGKDFDQAIIQKYIRILEDVEKHFSSE